MVSQTMACAKCNGLGAVRRGKNDLPCDCPLGDTAMFNVKGVLGQVTGAEMRRHFLRGSPEPLRIRKRGILASELPGREGDSDGPVG